MLAAIYLSVTAQPISLRRLVVLFVVVLVVTDSVSVAFGVKNPLHAASIMAATVTLAAWSSPLLRWTYCTIYRRRPYGRPALLGVSGFIRWTYCLPVAFALTMTVSLALGPTHHLAVAGLLRPIVLSAGIALCLAAKTGS
jgi:hypothetical protein